jgi:orotate phosphoribosyltransferase
MNGYQASLGLLLFRLGAIKLSGVNGELAEGYKLKKHEKHPDAPRSPIYLNLRTDQHPTNPGPLTPYAMQLIGEIMYGALKDVHFDHYVGIPEAGEPFADEIEKTYKGWATPPSRLRLRKEQLPDGTRKITDEVIGDYAPGDVVLVIDDLITQADSKLEAIAALESQGLVVYHVLVLVDRQEGGAEQLAEKDYTLLRVFSLNGLLCLYVDEMLISNDKADEVRNYQSANTLRD